MENGSKELAEAIKHRSWRDASGLSARDYALCAVAEKLSETPTRMVEADWKPLRDLGFDDQAILEVAHIVGIFNYLTRLADGLGLQLDPATETASRSGVALKRRDAAE